MVAAELRYGAEKSARRAENGRLVAGFLEPYEIVPFDDDAASVYSGVRHDCEKRGAVVGPNDLIIAATALSRNGTLVTRNTREFSAIKGLPLQDWTL